MFSFFKRKKPAPLPEALALTPDMAEDVAPVAPTELPEGLVPAPALDEPVVGVETTVPPEQGDAAPLAAEDASANVEPVEDFPGRVQPPDAWSDRPDMPAVDPLAQLDRSDSPDDGSGTSWVARLRRGLSRTGQNLGSLFVGVKVDETLFDELETALIMADAGVEASQRLISELRVRVRRERINEPEAVRAALQSILADHLKVLEKPFMVGEVAPMVVMIAGVNGAGKTTSIGKLAHALRERDASVLLAAGDTFRAAAREQLVAWGTRNGVTVIAQEGGDPAAVAFDAVNAGRARGVDVVLVDTAGRLPTQLHLMEELKKIRRVIAKADAAAPHEVLLVVDGNTGQNALAQIRAFDAALGLTGLIVTKLDGTAKGGTLAAVAAGSQGVRPIPVYWIGVGEGMQDLQPFVAAEFAEALLGRHGV
ncbi:MAG TPA: signal recognition particle-docking protein FtsY [Castellaniella sp.]|uniref:signal recognition particle-docking protein FtsY n=1 Tax=Castellaniella sp. TaxID=1955812 RepID=UPI002F0F5985